MRLVADGSQALCLGVVVVKADIQLLVELVDQVLHGLEAHHLGEVFQLREVLAGDRDQGRGGAGGVGGVLGGVVLQVVHVAWTEVFELLIQTNEGGFHGVPCRV